LAAQRVELEGGGGPLQQALEETIRRAEGPEALWDDILGLLARYGYWDARVRRLPDNVWAVEAGPRWSLEPVEVEVMGGQEAPEGWAALVEGTQGGLQGPLPPEPQRVAGAARRLLEFWARHGHPFARVVPLLVTHDAPQATLRLAVDPGPRVEVAEVVFRGDPGTRPGFLRRLIHAPEPGAPYDEGWARRARERLLETGLFLDVSVAHLEGLAEDTTGALRARVVFDLTPGRRNEVEAALGYSGSARTLAGRAHLGLTNPLGGGREVRLSWERFAPGRSRFRVAYRDPFLWRLPVAWSVELDHRLEDTLYVRTQTHLLLRWEMTSGLSLEAGLEALRSVAAAAYGGTRKRTASVFGVRWVRGDPASGGLKGWARWSHARERGGDGGGRHAVDGVEFVTELGLPVGRELRALGRFAVRGRFQPEPIPLFDAYPLGGIASLRGYAEESFWAVRYGVAQMELEWAGTGFHLFSDVGWWLAWEAAESPGLGVKGRTRLRGAYGVGARTPSQRGWVQVDYAIPWGEDPTAGRLHLRLGAPF
jgi:outer membrane protein assembly factor BamA